MEEADFSICPYVEARTFDGQLFNFLCPIEEAEMIKTIFRTKIKSLEIFKDRKVNVLHGGFGKYSRYDIVQHDYAGGGNEYGWSYKEILEIKNPPEGRWGLVIHMCTSSEGAVFSEWDTLKNAQEAYKVIFKFRRQPEELFKLDGFKRQICCGALTPWFYAIGDEELINDYAFPVHLTQDTVFRFGQRFLVYDQDDYPSIKTCMGTHFVQVKPRNNSLRETSYRLVYWDDGSVWDESISQHLPRLLKNDELWIAEAMQQFREMLSGKRLDVSVNFSDGTKFTGKLAKTKCSSLSAEGDYRAVVNLKGKKKPIEGWVYKFKPTKEAPDVIQFISQQFAAKEKIVERIEIKERKPKLNGKKWGGEFFAPPSK